MLGVLAVLSFSDAQVVLIEAMHFMLGFNTVGWLIFNCIVFFMITFYVKFFLFISLNYRWYFVDHTDMFQHTLRD